ncbi:hypothetical protein ACHAL6_02195 [Proteiniclasticum sp. C24MP]|uniref:hypothetical protein n=1 Tax=Proteiniclasticum sp. C24MP TaxID=3374101 RepID=UPI003754BA61
MNETGKLQSILRELVHLLEMEKEVLIKSDAASLLKIIEKKNLVMKAVEEEKVKGVIADEEVRTLGKRIERLQETNLLLTKQALTYQEEILKALAKSNTSRFSTYSAKGSYSSEKEVRLVDQSV